MHGGVTGKASDGLPMSIWQGFKKQRPPVGEHDSKPRAATEGRPYSSFDRSLSNDNFSQLKGVFCAFFRLIRGTMPRLAAPPSSVRALP